MATLADSFLADFESSGDEDEEEEEELGFENGEGNGTETTKGGADDDDDDSDDDSDDDIQIQEFNFDDDSDAEGGDETPEEAVNSIASLLDDEELVEHMEMIDELQKDTENEYGVHENVDRDLEYDTIIRSNEYVTEIDNEIHALHKFVKDLYATKYQELEQLVQTPLEYAQVVKIIGNETDLTLVEHELAGIVPNATILTISVTATTTIGQPLPDIDLKKVALGCDGIIRLDQHKRTIYDYIQSRMAFIAPNVSTLVGSEIAARLMGAAGGLEELSVIPSCNLQVLGIKKKTLGGFSAAKADLHMGILFETDIIRNTPPELRGKAMRLLAGKCTLACRADAHQDDATGALGKKFLDMITKKIDKWQEPPPPKLIKALPKPLPPKRKRRGGKRYRKEKEKYKITETQKQLNRMPFMSKEQTDEYTGQGFGMLGQAHASGALSSRAVNPQKLSKSLSKKTKQRMQRIKGASTGSTSGMVSTIAFTPVQGMELVNPGGQINNAGSNKYFSDTGRFFKVGGSKRQKY